MATSRRSGSFGLRAAPMVGALLPFVLLLFLLPEPTASPVEDYFPSSRARTITVKIIKSLQSCQSDSDSASSRDFAVGDLPQSAAICQASIDAELYIHLRHFSLLTNRLVRSPPGFSL